ncbi:BTAD domain-containing putative transcriptional regulator [Micromonospora profundi]|uniref:BTAD domain-containing putative transcriptional regulator n=1 Tax=Micromonospora profundi TaxID=1420889 RepID=UPI002FF386AF
MTDLGDRGRPLLFELLGPLRVRRDGQDLDLGPRQQRLILALLLTRAGQPVSTQEVITMLWGSQPPASAKNIVHRCIGNLRHLFEPDIAPRAQGRWITSDAAGYRVVADESNLDLLAFRKLAGEARAAADTGNPGAALTAYTKALEMWRGPCAGASDLLVDQLAPFNAIDHECAAAAVEAADLSLRLDSGRSVLNILRRVATHQFFNEALQARFILVLSAAGQQAEAIARYHSLRRKLLDELGVEPGAEVQAAYREILEWSSVRREDKTCALATEKKRSERCTVIPGSRSSFSRYDGATHTASITVGSDDIGANGSVRSPRYLDYSIRARCAALADAGLSIKELAAAGLGPVDLEVSIKYLDELVLGDEVDVVTRFEYLAPKIVRLVQSMIRRSDGAIVSVVTSVTSLMDTTGRWLVDDATVWAEFPRDRAVVDLAERPKNNQA